MNSRAISRFSSAAVGSSRISTRQRRRSALAMATICCSAKPSCRTGRSGSGAKSKDASCARASSRMRARSMMAGRPNSRRTGGSPSARFSAIDSAGTRCSSCGMVMTPLTIASCGLDRWHARPPMVTCPSSGRATPPRMRTSVDFPAPFSPTSAWISPARTSKLTPSSAVVAPNRLRMFCAAAAMSFMGSCFRCGKVLAAAKPVNVRDWRSCGDRTPGPGDKRYLRYDGRCAE